MVSQRSQSDFTMEQPVRFYKLIALTFLLLTIVLLGLVVFMSSKRATITITTKASPVDVNTDLVISAQPAQYELTGSIKTELLQGSQQFVPTGTRDEQGVATGRVTIFNTSERAQPLVANTRLLTPEKILFKLESGVTVPAHGQVDDVVVYAAEKGSGGNVGASDFTIPGLNETRQKEIYARSAAPMTGGIRSIGAVGQKDIETARARLAESLQESGKTQFGAPADGLGTVYGLVDLKDNGNEMIGEEGDTFELVGSGRMVAITYTTQELQNWAQKQLGKHVIGDSESIRTGDGEAQVRFSDFDAQTGKATVHVFYNGRVALNAESPQIEKSIFFGKTRDEVRRYLLSLDHVSDVDVNFQPAWMRTVPHIHDHVTVFVKEIE